jgi:hypothetical protein
LLGKLLQSLRLRASSLLATLVPSSCAPCPRTHSSWVHSIVDLRDGEMGWEERGAPTIWLCTAGGLGHLPRMGRVEISGEG